MRFNHNIDIDRYFYNDRILQVIPQSDIDEPFTYVPIKAGHMELVNGNAVMFGNITEGYGPVPVDVDVEFVCNGLPSIGYSQITFPIKWHNVDFDSDAEGFYHLYHLIATLPLTVYAGATYTISMTWPEVRTASYTAVGGDSVEDVRDGLVNSLTIAGFDIEVCTTPKPNKICMYARKVHFLTSDPYPWTVEPAGWKINGVINIDTYIKKYTQLKRGSKHGFGVVYKDDCGRQNSVAKTDELNLNLPFYSDPVYGDAIGTQWLDCGEDSILNPVFHIYNTPPSWAKTYEIVYCGNLSMESWLQLRADAITDLTNNRYSVNIQTNLDATRTKNERWKVGDWIWDNGDRMRLIGTIDAATGVVSLYSTLYDYEIELQDATDNLLIQAVNHPTPFATATNIIIEIYRPKKGLGLGGASDISIFYGSGMAFEIDTDAFGNKYHMGDVDQVIDINGIVVTPAEVINRSFDSWKFWRLNYVISTTTIKPFYAESNLPSDWWDKQLLVNRITSKGFPFLYDISQKQSVLAKRFRWGGYLLSGTQVNNIAHFTYADFKDLAEKDGAITGMRETGYTVSAIQWHKETSIYINRIQNFNADGTDNFTLTDALIGSIRPLETAYGCQHPDSILVNGRNIYYWDNIEGKLIRSAPNGQQVISGPPYKVSRWFKDLGKWIIANGGAQKLEVRFGYNVEHDELWTTFRIDTTVYGMIFSESRGRWVSQLNQRTDAYVHAGEFFAHLYLQKLWIMNIDEGQDWLTWSGTPTYADIEVVSNIEPSKNKIFNAIAKYVDHIMQSLSKYIYIPAEAAANGYLMESNVSVWEKREAVYFGEILRDENTKGNFVNLNDRKMNGQFMRGRYIFVRLKTEEHDEKVRIDAISIMSTLSERNV